jgi:hypothetical protein
MQCRMAATQLPSAHVLSKHNPSKPASVATRTTQVSPYTPPTTSEEANQSPDLTKLLPACHALGIFPLECSGHHPTTHHHTPASYVATSDRPDRSCQRDSSSTQLHLDGTSSQHHKLHGTQSSVHGFHMPSGSGVHASSSRTPTNLVPASGNHLPPGGHEAPYTLPETMHTTSPPAPATPKQKQTAEVQHASPHAKAATLRPPSMYQVHIGLPPKSSTPVVPAPGHVLFPTGTPASPETPPVSCQAPCMPAGASHSKCAVGGPAEARNMTPRKVRIKSIKIIKSKLLKLNAQWVSKSLLSSALTTPKGGSVADAHVAGSLRVYAGDGEDTPTATVPPFKLPGTSAVQPALQAMAPLPTTQLPRGAHSSISKAAAPTDILHRAHHRIRTLKRGTARATTKRSVGAKATAYARHTLELPLLKGEGPLSPVGLVALGLQELPAPLNRAAAGRALKANDSTLLSECFVGAQAADGLSTGLLPDVGTWGDLGTLDPTKPGPTNVVLFQDGPPPTIGNALGHHRPAAVGSSIAAAPGKPGRPRKTPQGVSGSHPTSPTKLVKRGPKGKSKQSAAQHASSGLGVAATWGPKSRKWAKAAPRGRPTAQPAAQKAPRSAAASTQARLLAGVIEMPNAGFPGVLEHVAANEMNVSQTLEVASQAHVDGCGSVASTADWEDSTQGGLTSSIWADRHAGSCLSSTYVDAFLGSATEWAGGGLLLPPVATGPRAQAGSAVVATLARLHLLALGMAEADVQHRLSEASKLTPLGNATGNAPVGALPPWPDVVHESTGEFGVSAEQWSGLSPNERAAVRMLPRSCKARTNTVMALRTMVCIAEAVPSYPLASLGLNVWRCGPKLAACELPPRGHTARCNACRLRWASGCTQWGSTAGMRVTTLSCTAPSAPSQEFLMAATMATRS